MILIKILLWTVGTIAFIFIGAFIYIIRIIMKESKENKKETENFVDEIMDNAEWLKDNAND